MREFLLGQTLGTVELKLLEKGHYKRILLDALQKEEGDRSVIGLHQRYHGDTEKRRTSGESGKKRFHDRTV